MQRQDYSQATSALDNTPNLNIVFLRRETCIGSQTGNSERRFNSRFTQKVMFFQRHLFYSQPINRLFWTSNNVAGIFIKFLQQMLQAKMSLIPRNNNSADLFLKRLQYDSCFSAISVHMGDTFKSDPNLFYWEIDFMEANFTAFRPVFCKWNV